MSFNKDCRKQSSLYFYTATVRTAWYEFQKCIYYIVWRSKPAISHVSLDQKDKAQLKNINLFWHLQHVQNCDDKSVMFYKTTQEMISERNVNTKNLFNKFYWLFSFLLIQYLLARSGIRDKRRESPNCLVELSTALQMAWEDSSDGWYHSNTKLLEMMNEVKLGRYACLSNTQFLWPRIK